MSNSTLAIETENLSKYYGDIHAVDGISLKIPKGKIFGLLGPNGAGKSTTMSMLSTITLPTKGKATILGFDLKNDRWKIREYIGLCPQELAIYEKLSAKENLYLIAQMHNLKPIDYKDFADELLAKMNLLDRKDDLVKTFSGGMKRRINVLMAVVHQPDIVFLDEPTAGLDPQSRRVVWDFIRDMEKENKTIILTTHNMEEADDLSDKLVILDYGKVLAEGTPEYLKNTLGKGDIIEFQVPRKYLNNRKEIALEIEKEQKVRWAKELGKERIQFCSLNSLNELSHYYELIQKIGGFSMQNIVIRQNTLEDVFIHLTGRGLRD